MIRLPTILIALSLLLACASSSPPTKEKLDPLTAVTLTYSGTAMILYRDDPGRAAHARNFVSLGPLEVNRSGNYQHFLWLGIWNTNHSAPVDERLDGFDSIVLFVDGEPLQMDVVGWTPAAIGASEPIYPRPVASSLDAYYPVTADQIRLLADASNIYLQTTGRSPRSFEQWNDQSAAFRSFRALLSRF